MFCSKCGHKNEDGMKWCSNCGTKFGSAYFDMIESFVVKNFITYFKISLVVQPLFLGVLGAIFGAMISAGMGILLFLIYGLVGLLSMVVTGGLIFTYLRIDENTQKTGNNTELLKRVVELLEKSSNEK